MTPVRLADRRVLRTGLISLAAAGVLVASGCGDGGTDGAPVARFAVEEPTALARGAGGLYVGQADGTVTRRDPDGGVLARTRLSGDITALRVQGGYLAAAVDDTNEVVLMDAGTLRVVRRARPVRGLSGGITALGGDGAGVVVADTNGSRIVRLAVPSLRITAVTQLPRGSAPLALVATGGTVHVTSINRLPGEPAGVIRIGPAGRVRFEPLRVSRSACGIAVRNGVLTVATRVGLAIMDPATLGNRNGISVMEDGADGIVAAGDRDALVTGAEGLSRVAYGARPNETVATVPAGADCGVADGSFTWLYDTEGNALIRIGAGA